VDSRYLKNTTNTASCYYGQNINLVGYAKVVSVIMITECMFSTWLVVQLI
jgi:hypothetical protein